MAKQWVAWYSDHRLEIWRPILYSYKVFENTAAYDNWENWQSTYLALTGSLTFEY